MPLVTGPYVSVHVPDATEAVHNLASGTAAGFCLEAAMHTSRRVISHYTTLANIAASAPGANVRAAPSQPSRHQHPAQPSPQHPSPAASSQHAHPSASPSQPPHTSFPHAQPVLQPPHQAASSPHVERPTASTGTSNTSTGSITSSSSNGSSSNSSTGSSSSSKTASASTPTVTSVVTRGTYSSSSTSSRCPAQITPRASLLSGLTVAGIARGSVANLIAGSVWSGMFGSVYVPVSQSVEATLARANRRSKQHPHDSAEHTHHIGHAARHVDTDRSHERSVTQQAAQGDARVAHDGTSGSSSSGGSSADAGGCSSTSHSSDVGSRIHQSTSGRQRQRQRDRQSHSDHSHAGSAIDSGCLWLVPACAAGAASLVSSAVRVPLEEVTAWQARRGGHASSALQVGTALGSCGVPVTERAVHRALCAHSALCTQRSAHRVVSAWQLCNRALCAQSALCTQLCAHSSVQTAAGAATAGAMRVVSHAAGGSRAPCPVIVSEQVSALCDAYRWALLHAAGTPFATERVTRCRSVVKSQGVGGLYRGWGRSVACGVPLDAALFTIYDALKQRGVAHQGGERELHAHETAIAGGVSGVLAATLTVPLDVAFAERSTSSVNSSSQCTIASLTDRRAVLTGLSEARCTRDASLVASGSGSGSSRGSGSGSSGSSSSGSCSSGSRGSGSRGSGSGSSFSNDGGGSSGKAPASAAVTPSGRSAGALYTAGLRAHFWKAAHKVGWTAFGSAVFFPCLEAGIVAFDVHLHETDLGSGDEDEHPQCRISGIPIAGMHVYH
ncbi:MAG: hypothetical protein WDW38_007370 [Sanguina aurantia]